MREIKFRAWDSQIKKWYAPKDISVGGDGVVWVCGDGFMGWEEVPPDVVHLMQFTGLHDKNGKEIWEGDILSNGHYNCEVYWNQERGAWYWRTPSNQDGMAIYVCVNEGLFEVLGNVHEHPHLLDTHNA